KTLQEVYKSSTVTRITAAGTNSLLVYAGPEEHIEIAKQILGPDGKGSKPEMIPVGDLDPIRVAETLKGMFGETKTGGPYIEAQLDRGAVVVSGTRNQKSEVNAAVKVLTGNAGNAGDFSNLPPNMRVITIP